MNADQLRETIQETVANMSEEERETWKNVMASDAREFKEWILPFYWPFIQKLPARNWQFKIDFASVWIESPYGLRVMLGGQTEEDGKKWLHLSVSRANRVPSYDDLTKVKRMFFGEEAKAIFIFAPESEHINIHPFVLHLWHCLDGDTLPDFRKEAPGGILAI